MLKQLKNYRKSFRNYIPWECEIEDGIILTKYNNGGFQATMEIRNYDLDYYPPEAIRTVVKRLNNLYKKLPDGFSIHYEVQRKKTENYITKNLDNKPLVTRVIDKLREDTFKNRNFFETKYYITLSYVIFEDLKKDVDKFFRKKQRKLKDNEYLEIMEQYKKDFKNTLNSFIEGLKGMTIKVELLKNEELMKFLYSTINSEQREKILIPPRGYYLDEYLSNSNFTDGIDFKIDNKYLKTISLSVFPDTAIPRLFKELENLDFEFRYVTRYIILSKEEAIKTLEGYREYHKGKSRKGGQWFKEIITQKETVNINTSAIESSEEANSALGDLRKGFLSYGLYTFTFLVMDKDLKRLNDNCLRVKQIIENIGFNATIEEFNTFESFTGAVPGNVATNIRKLPLNTALLTYLLPISSIFDGEKWNKHLKDIPLMITNTGERDLFRLNLHINQTGHTLIIGRTGGGKSVLLGMLAAQYMKYENARVAFFDKKASSMVLTHLMGGEFYNLGKNELSFQPLSRVDEYSELVWANDWIISLLEQENVIITPEIKGTVWRALNTLTQNEPKRRTLSIFSTHCQNHEIEEALKSYTKLGSYGQYFDNHIDNIKQSKWQVFEMEEVINIPKVCEPLMDYLFHRIETDMLNGDPFLLLLDESWLFLKNPKMKNKIGEWLRVLRSKNGVVVFATQSLDEIEKSDIASVIIDSCKTKIFLSNPQAATKDRYLYEALGLNEEEIFTVSEAKEREEYFYISELGSRLFQMKLPKSQLIMVGSSTKEDHRKIMEIKKNSVNIEEVNLKWIEFKKETNEISEKTYENLKRIIIGGNYEKNNNDNVNFFNNRS